MSASYPPFFPFLQPFRPFGYFMTELIPSKKTKSVVLYTPLSRSGSIPDCFYGVPENPTLDKLIVYLTPLHKLLRGEK